MALPAEPTDARAGAALDLDALFEAHADFVRRAVAHLAGPALEPDDLVQEVFVQAWRSRSRFAGRSSVRTWLYGVTLGVVRNARRRSRLRRFFGLESAAEPEDPTPAAPDRLAQEEARRQVHALLETLPEKKRTVLVLFELEGLTGEEIAAVVGCPVATVWTRLHHARQAFARALERAEALERERARRRP
jgi:RNA polymerase sigma-70 factor (ECF subfamily)